MRNELMSAILSIPVEDLKRRPDSRPIDNAAVAALSESIEALGVINPIRVRLIVGADPIAYEVIAGSHRMAACDLLGHRTIPCIVVNDDDQHAELTLIDENLMRSELTPAERASQTARRKAILADLALIDTHGGDRRPEQVANMTTCSFAAHTAAATGQSERTVRRDAERGEKVVDEALDMIQGTKLDTGVYLDRIKSLPPNEQVQAVERDLKADFRARDPAARPAPKPKPGEPYQRFIGLVGEIEAIDIREVLAAARRVQNGPAQLSNRAAGLRERLDEMLGAFEDA